ncbi:unnamed protein product, partial [marine sediment metagenome]
KESVIENLENEKIHKNYIKLVEKKLEQNK